LKVRHAHIPELQSIRGIAAAVVLLHHSSFLFATTPHFRLWSEVVLNAHAAVMLFFVLSGYVLSRSLSGPQLDLKRIGEFYVARAFRIYPALWLACAIGLTYLAFLHFKIPTLHFSNWYVSFFQSFPSPDKILVNFTLGKEPAAIVPPSWSIFVEMIGSLALPAFVIANREKLGIWLFVLLVGLAAIASSNPKIGYLIYLPSFSIGALAFRYHDRLKPYFANLPVLILCLVVVQFFRLLSPDWRFEQKYVAFPPALVESIFAAGVVLCVAVRPVAFLRNPFLVWLGDISYSLYLIHFILMSALAKFIGTLQAPVDVLAVALMLATFAASIPLAWLAYSFIEKPGIALGKKLIGTMK